LLLKLNFRLFGFSSKPLFFLFFSEVNLPPFYLKSSLSNTLTSSVFATAFITENSLTTAFHLVATRSTPDPELALGALFTLTFL
jgi:hypothetical protein